MFKKISSADGTLISYQHDESGEMFRRFMGGLCMSSGFVFIVGEELFEIDVDFFFFDPPYS